MNLLFTFQQRPLRFMLLLHLTELMLFVVFAINILYLLLFSVASRCRKTTSTPPPHSNDAPKRIVLLIPAYKEDNVITECVESCLRQNYPRDCYDIAVISDRMRAETNQALIDRDALVIAAHFENSTKAKALNYAMTQIGTYDLALILDADNTILPDFLTRINATFTCTAVRIVQAHRCAKNLNTPLSLLDAMSEEINNNIFRQGHVNMGLSAALIGSGMAFDYTLFKSTMLRIDAVGGFDRALELALLSEGEKIDYLPTADVFDEKVQQHREFTRQRRRWLSAQWHYFSASIREVPAAVMAGKWDFCDKVFQQMSIPRVILLGFTTLITIAVACIAPMQAIKWLILWLLLGAALGLSIPKRLFTGKLCMAILQLPYFFLLMTLNLFRLRGANKKFIHTSHGVKS